MELQTALHRLVSTHVPDVTAQLQQALMSLCCYYQRRLHAGQKVVLCIASSTNSAVLFSIVTLYHSLKPTRSSTPKE